MGTPASDGGTVTTRVAAVVPVLDECSALNPQSLYARSKIASERVLMALADEKFCPVILRFGTIFGLGKQRN